MKQDSALTEQETVQSITSKESMPLLANQLLFPEHPTFPASDPAQSWKKPVICLQQESCLQLLNTQLHEIMLVLMGPISRFSNYCD